MLIGEIVQRVQSLYSRGVPSDDSRLSSRLIYNKMLTVRSRLLSQEANKKQRSSQWNYQPISCVELIKVPPHECPCLPPIGCEILRSKYKLPRPITGLSGNLIQSVTTIDRLAKIDEITINALNSLKGNKYTFKKRNYFIENGYLYISTPDLSNLGVIRVIGLFEDPIEVKEYEGLCDECPTCSSCLDYYEEVFPLDSSMIDPLIELTVQELIILFGQSIPDEVNNSNDDVNNNRRRQ